MTGLDYGIIALMGIPCILGLFRGFIRSLFTLVGSLAGFALAVIFSRSAGEMISRMMGQPEMTGRIAAFFLIFLGCWLTGLILGFFTMKLISTLKLRWVDRLIGGAFGLIKGGILVTTALIVITRFPNLKPFIDNAAIAPGLIHGANTAVTYLPENWKTYVDPHRWLGRLPPIPEHAFPAEKSSDPKPTPAAN